MDGGGICSGTAVGPHLILTATHCFGEGPLVPTPETSALAQVNGKPVSTFKRIDDGQDHSLVVVDITFDSFAAIASAPRQGDRVFLYGNPAGMHDMYREGYVTGFDHESSRVWTLYDVNGYMGDSGSGIFNERGDVVAVTSVLIYISEMGLPFKLMATLPLQFTANQYADVGLKVNP
jgi:V8-like Glu-specific endopeptidase